MKRALAFVVLAGGGLGALVLASGGLRGAARMPSGARPTLDAGEPLGVPGTPVAVDTLPLGRDMPKNAPRIQVQPMGALVKAIQRPKAWVDPVTRRTVELPYYTEYAVRVEETSAEPVAGSGVPMFRWRRVHVTAYRDVSTLSATEVANLVARPESRRDLVRYEMEADEGSANLRLTAVPDDAKKPPPVRFVLRLTKNVRIRLVADDVSIRTSDLVLDQDAETVTGDGDLVAERPGVFTATGTGLRIDKRSGRFEILRRVAVDVRELADERGRGDGFDLAGGPFRPRRLRTLGPVVVTRHGPDAARPASFEAVLSDDVRVEAADGSELDAQRVTLDLVPRAPVAGARGPTPEPGRAPPPGDPALPATRERWRLRSFGAEGDVRVRRDERDPALAADAPPVRRVVVETDRLTGRFDDPARGTATLDGRTVLFYQGLLGLPGARPAPGTVTARCRERVTVGPPVAAAETAVADLVVELLGDVEVDGTVPPSEGSERLSAARVRLLLRDAGTPGAKPAAAGDPMGDLVAVGFTASGGDVRISGPTVAGRAREMRAEGLDRPDRWTLALAGPDAWLEVTESATRPPDAAAAGGKAADGKPAPARASRSAWVPDRLDARGAVHGQLAPRPGDAPVEFTGETLTYTEAEGGELRGADGVRARLVHPGAAGRDQSVEAPVVGFRIGDDGTSLWTRGGTRAVVWTDLEAKDGPRRKDARRTVVLRGAEALTIAAGRSAAGEPTVTVTARDGAALESRLDGTRTDRLEARHLTITLAERASSAARPLGLRRTAPGGAATAARRAPGPTAPAGLSRTDGPTRWTLECASVDVETAAMGGDLAALRAFTASGGVVAASDSTADGSSQRFAGASLALRVDGAVHRGRLEGTTADRATLSATDEDLPQWIASPSVDFVLDGLSLVSATFAPPVSARFHHRAGDGGLPLVPGAAARPTKPAPPAGAPAKDAPPAGAPAKDAPPASPRKAAAKDAAKRDAAAALERIALRADGGPLVLERLAGGASPRMRATLTGTEAAPVVLARSRREPGAPEFGPAVRLASPRIELTVRGALGASDVTPEQFVATGPGTRVEIPDDTGATTASGTSLTFDGATSVLRIEDPAGVWILTPRLRVRSPWFSYNVATGARDVGPLWAEAAR